MVFIQIKVSKVLGKVVDAKGRAKRKYGRCVFCDVHLVSRTARRDSIEIM
jgi:NifB/MoaA-like Fe-S oxidoreductase